ncbi:MAG: hypothetical protein JWR16_2622 [Nevskia sp.]|nr:hypothetical protein [Nevskia sp.]
MSTAAPLFIFSAPYCGASRLAAMLGRHPEVCALPELSLFVGDDIGELLEIAEFSHGLMLDGLLRAIAQLAFGEQGDVQIQQARDWLEQRPQWSIAALLQQLRGWAQPRLLVIPDAQAPLRPVDLQRCAQAAPDARYLHLTRHPYTQGALFAPALKERQFVPTDYKDHSHKPPQIDPQIPWLRANLNILRAQAAKPAVPGLAITAEALEADVDATLTRICHWLGLKVGTAELSLMRDYRAWPFLQLGPTLAPLGLEAEAYQMDDARYRRHAAGTPTLSAPMPWKPDRSGFSTEVRELAATFGYR